MADIKQRRIKYGGRMEAVERRRHWLIIIIAIAIILWAVGSHCPWSVADEDPWEFPKLILALIAAMVAYFEYLRHKRDSRIAMLLDLHERFIDTEKFSTIRNLIEAQDAQFLARVRYVATHPDTPYSDNTVVDAKNNIKMDVAQIGELDEYTDFMDMVAYLALKLNFNHADMLGIFGYWMRQLKEIAAVYDYIRVDKFEFYSLREVLESYFQDKSH